MSIQTEINRIRQSKADIISALKLKGATVPEDASIEDLSALVEAIEVGSSEDLSSELTSQSALLTTQTSKLNDLLEIIESKSASNITLILSDNLSVSDDGIGNVVIS